MSTGILPESAVAKKAQKPPVQATENEEMDRVEFQAPKSWVEKLDDAANALGMSRSAYIRMACNRQMQRDEAGRD